MDQNVGGCGIPSFESMPGADWVAFFLGSWTPYFFSAKPGRWDTSFLWKEYIGIAESTPGIDDGNLGNPVVGGAGNAGGWDNSLDVATRVLGRRLEPFSLSASQAIVFSNFCCMTPTP